MVVFAGLKHAVRKKKKRFLVLCALTYTLRVPVPLKEAALPRDMWDGAAYDSDNCMAILDFQNRIWVKVM